MADPIGINHEQFQIRDIPYNSTFSCADATDNADNRDVQILKLIYWERGQLRKSMSRCDSRMRAISDGIVQPDMWRSIALHEPVREAPNAVFAELAAPTHLG